MRLEDYWAALQPPQPTTAKRWLSVEVRTASQLNAAFTAQLAPWMQNQRRSYEEGIVTFVKDDPLCQHPLILVVLHEGVHSGGGFKAWYLPEEVTVLERPEVYPV